MAGALAVTESPWVGGCAARRWSEMCSPGLDPAQAGVASPREVGVSEPSEYPPGAYYTIERCVLHRQYRLLPDAELNSAFAMAMVVAGERTGVELIAWSVMSNHYHALVRDPEGRLPEWTRDVHALMGRFVNERDDAEAGVPLWDRQGHNHTRIQGLERIIDRAVYILSNPVVAGLVRSPWEWPGLLTPRAHLGRGTGAVHTRPERFFRADGPVPAAGELVSHAPAGVDPEDFRARVFAGVEERVADAHRRVQAEGRTFLGLEALRRLNPFGRPRVRRERKAGHAAERRPMLLGSTREETEEMFAAEQSFRERYAAALVRLRQRASDAIFPPGAFMLWRFFGALREVYDPSVLALVTRT